LGGVPPRDSQTLMPVIGTTQNQDGTNTKRVFTVILIFNAQGVKKTRSGSGEGKKIMANETDVNFEYIPGGRYIVEINDENWKAPIFSRRLKSIATAQEMKDEHKFLEGMSARIHDTKTGEII